MWPRYTLHKLHLTLLLESDSATDALLYLSALSAQTASDPFFDFFLFENVCMLHQFYFFSSFGQSKCFLLVWVGGTEHTLPSPNSQGLCKVLLSKAPNPPTAPVVCAHSSEWICGCLQLTDASVFFLLPTFLLMPPCAGDS